MSESTKPEFGKYFGTQTVSSESLVSGAQLKPSSTLGTGAAKFPCSPFIFGQPIQTTAGAMTTMSSSEAFFGKNEFRGQTLGTFGQPKFMITDTSGSGTVPSFSGCGPLYSSPFFGPPSPQITATVVKFNPLIATDQMVKNSNVVNVQTSHQCISSMKEYENKSLEELRVENYLANRKFSPQPPFTWRLGTPATTTTSAGFSLSATQITSAGLFSNKLSSGTTSNPSFGTPVPRTAVVTFGQQHQSVICQFEAPGTVVVNIKFEDPSKTFVSIETSFGNQVQRLPLFGTEQNPAVSFGHPTMQSVSDTRGRTFGTMNTFGGTATSGTSGTVTFGQPVASSGFGSSAAATLPLNSSRQLSDVGYGKF